MTLTYDKQANALYIKLNNKDVANTKTDDNEQLLIDYASDNAVVGIEILNVSDKLSMPLQFNFKEI